MIVGNVHVVLRFDHLEEKYIHFCGQYKDKTITVLRTLKELNTRHLLKVDDNLLTALGYDDTDQLRANLKSFRLVRRNDRNAIADLTIEFK